MSNDAVDLFALLKKAWYVTDETMERSHEISGQELTIHASLALKDRNSSKDGSSFRGFMEDV